MAMPQLEDEQREYFILLYLAWLWVLPLVQGLLFSGLFIAGSTKLFISSRNWFSILHVQFLKLLSHLSYVTYLRVFQEAVQVLLKHSADVNARDKNWQTPLHTAAANKAVKCAEALVPLLSNVNVSDRAGRTALHHAALSGHGEVGAALPSVTLCAPTPVTNELTCPASFYLCLPSSNPQTSFHHNSWCNFLTFRNLSDTAPTNTTNCKTMWKVYSVIEGKNI